MFRIQDLNPIFRAPHSLVQSNGNTTNTSGVNATGTNVGNPAINTNPVNSNVPLTPSFANNINQYNNYTQNQNQSNSSSSEKLLTFTNYYKFCCLNNVNCYFYQFNNITTNSNSTSNNNNASGSTYEIVKYEQLIKNKLKTDYQINDIITWIAKKELCLFQLQVEDPTQSFDPSVGFNQLKDAMSNIISENKLSLKLISASTFNADKIFGNNSTSNNSTQNQLQKKSLNVVYLSFLRAVHKFVLQKMTKSHSLFETSNQSLSIDILPYSGQLITSSMIQKTVVPTQNNSEFGSTAKKRKILKKLVPYSILKISPSLNQKNELIINMTTLKKMFYKLTDYLIVTCKNSIKSLDEKSKFAIYIAPSGIRCLLAGDSFEDSITDQAPENFEKLFNILKAFNDIDLTQNSYLINEKRLWIKLHPIGFNSNNIGPIIANYLDTVSFSGKKFIYWPLELCFIQFPSDFTPGIITDEPSNVDNFEIVDPFQLVDEFIDIIDDIEKTKLTEETENNENFQNQKVQLDSPEDLKSTNLIKSEFEPNIKQEVKSEFKFPESFDFQPELDSIDQQLKPLKSINDVELDKLHDIIEGNNDFDDLFNQKEENLGLVPKSGTSVETDLQNEIRNVFNDHNVSGNIETNHVNIEPIQTENSISPDKKADSNFDEDWGDLFGDSGEEDDGKNVDEAVDSVLQELEDGENKEAVGNTETKIENESKLLPANSFGDQPIENNSESIIHDNTICPTNNNQSSVSEHLQPKSTLPSQTIENDEVMDTSPLYQDPGAPSPIPFQIFAPPPSSSEDSSPISAEDKEKSVVKQPFGSLTPRDRRKSIFSPLTFNPLIEKDIDSKYSNGGKFFVKHNSTLSGTSTDSKSELYSDDPKKFSHGTNVATPLLENQPTLNPLANLTTPTFLMHGPGKSADGLFAVTSDSSSESDDEMTDIGETVKSDELLGGIAKLIENDDIGDTAFDNDDINVDIDLDNDGNGEISNDNENSIDGENEDETAKFKDISDLSSDILGKRGNALGITVPGIDGNSNKRRKLETIFDSIVDDDDEIELDFDDDFNEEKNQDINNDEQFNNEESKDLIIKDNELTSDSKIDAELTSDKNIAEVGTFEIPNSWFYVLRPIAPIQIPFNFLQSVNLKVDSSKIISLLPILQEYVLLSQKYMNNQLLNMVVQNRECPSVLDNDVEYLFYKIFPGICKLNCYELLDSDKDSKQLKPFECLFGTNPPNNVNFHAPSKSDMEIKLYDDNNYNSTSPMLNIPPSDVQQNIVLPHYMDDVNYEFQKIDLSESIPSENLFRINPTVLNLKRLEENVIINDVGVNFWKMLNLEPLSKPKNFSVMFVIPKAGSEFAKKATHFLDGIISYYNVCRLGQIQKLNGTGIIEVEYGNGNDSKYWDCAQNKLLSIVEDLQTECTVSDDKSKVLLMFVDPFQDLNSLVSMSDVTRAFETALVEKQLPETDASKKKKKKKVKTITRLPITLFYKAFSVESFYLRDDGQLVIFTDKDYFNLVLELYNNCPNSGSQMMLKDRNNMFLIEDDIQKKVRFVLTKKPIRKLNEKETFLHLCYERSVDKKWCVASWVNQSGELNFTKSWYIDPKVDSSKSFKKVADDIMNITLEYVVSIASKCFVILTRLNNIIPDDELAEWKRLSMKNNDLVLVVMTAEIESSTLILSNNPGLTFNTKKKEEVSKDLNYTVASTNSQSQTPANVIPNSNNYVHHLVGSTKFESPDVSMYTPSYDNVLSPMDASSHQVQVPIQLLEPLPEDNAINDDTMSQNSILIDISDECYGLILQVSQPLSNQPRVPLKTGFLVNTGEGATKNRILEINLLSCQSGININDFLKTLLIQYRNLSSLAPFLGFSGIVRKCGNVEYDEMGEEEEGDDDTGNWEDDNMNSTTGLGLNVGNSNHNYSSDRKREKHIVQQQYMQFIRMQQKQKRQRAREREREITESDLHYNVIPVHMLAVRKLLDFLVNIEVE